MFIKKVIKNILQNRYSSAIKVNREILKRLIELGYSLTEIEQSVSTRLIELIDEDKREIKEIRSDYDKINLDNEYKWLDKVLYCSIGQLIDLGINKDMAGSNEYSYTLKNYSINGIDNSITLELERKDDYYKISFTEIQDIKWNGNKIWIYLKYENWRFFYHVDDVKIASLEKDFKSKNIELQEDIQIYMRYKDVDNLLYYVEKEKYSYKDYENDITQEEVTDKLGNRMILLNILDKERNGTIYAYSERGKEGTFFYQLMKDELYIVDMCPNKHSQGVGSKVLELMEKTARKYNIKELTGMLSSVDFGHKERLFHFYKKNGFIINDSESEIRKKIIC